MLIDNCIESLLTGLVHQADGNELGIGGQSREFGVEEEALHF